MNPPRSPQPGSAAPALLLAAWALILSPVQAQPDTPLPREFKPTRAQVRTITPPEGTTAGWETTHFRLLSDGKIDPATLQRFATTIESIPKLLEAPPFALWSPAPGVRPIIRLCRDEERFRHFGGPDGSAGYYDGRRRTVLIRADLFLTPPRDGNSRLAPPPNEDLLIHELSHLGMASIVSHAKPWLYEGLAEYLAAAHQGGGSFRFDNTPQAIRNHIQRHLTPDEKGALALPSFKGIFDTSGKDWIRKNEHMAPEKRYRPYASSLLLIHYYLEGGIERRTRLFTHLAALKAHDRRDPLPILTLDDPGETESRVTKFWSPRGLQLVFSDS